MSADLLEEYFPALKNGGYEITSPETEDYNCFAWALAETGYRIDPHDSPDCHWPENLPKSPLMESFLTLYRRKGFEICLTVERESGFEKIAIYANDLGEPVHAARQLTSGGWTSKIGDFEDIQHARLESLEGYYGKVAILMKRSLSIS